MTREEAIKHIITYAYYDDDIPLQVATALDMAIAALRAADGANAAARVKKPRAPKMTCDEMLQNLKSVAKGGDRQ